MNRLIPIALLLLPVLLAADTPAPAPDKPKSTAAVSAINREAKARAEAEQAFHESVLASKKVELSDLKLAQDAAMKQGGADALAEANRIAAVIQQVQREIDAMEKGPATKPTTKPSQATYTLWQFKWRGGENKNWLLSDGTVINQRGESGKWSREGNAVTFDWRGAKEKLTVSPDGQTAKGTAANGTPFTGEKVGTNLDGASPPPNH